MNNNERLNIINFCGIKDAEIVIKKYTVIIGPQSSGKSIISKLIYWFRYDIYSSFIKAMNGDTYRVFKDSLKKEFRLNFLFDKDVNFTINYTIGNFNVEIINLDSKLIINLSNESQKFIKDIVEVYKKSQKDIQKEEQLNSARVRIIMRDSFRNSASSFCKTKTVRNIPLYIPAARAFFTQIEDALFLFLSESKRLDFTIESFGDALRWAKKNKRMEDKESYFSEKTSKKILKGVFFSEKNSDYIKHDDGRIVPVSSASSGQQETLPLILVLDHIISSSTNNSRLFVVEEPEAHLHPEAQKYMIEAICHANDVSGSNVIITTHSPYILSVMNNLLMAGELKEKNKKQYDKDKLNEKMLFGATIKANELAAYSTNNDGYITSLIDEETGLLNAESIDQISSELSVTFDQMLEALYSDTNTSSKEMV
jgi:predicted ATPase